jgi:uncharacterized glyoxalase superfamily protein PhnB
MSSLDFWAMLSFFFAVETITQESIGMSQAGAYQVDGFAAVLGVREVSAAVAYYRDVLGFTVEFTWSDPPDYAGLRLGAACLHLAKAVTAVRQGRVCFFCTGLDSLHQQLIRNGATVTRPITEEPYGMREFWIADLEGHELIFGEPTRK